MELSRKDIYDMMWTEGIGKTEKKLGLKQTELKAICDKYDIPRPSSNYWSSLNYGKPATKIQLPVFNGDSTIRVESFIKPPKSPIIKKEKKNSDPVKGVDGKYEPRELPSEKNTTTIYQVPDILYAKDPIILDTKAKLREENFRNNNPWMAKNPFQCKADKWLSMRVSEEQEDRALRIYSTVIKAAEAKGYELKIKVNKDRYYPSCTTFFVVKGHEIQTFIREVFRQVTNEDGTKDRNRTEGSGVLKFECDKTTYHYGASYSMCVAQDTKYTRLEDKIEHIILTFEKIADERDEAERQRILDEERRKQEEERKRLEEEEKKRIKALKDAELERIQELLFDAERYKIANNIREYISAYEKMIGTDEGEEAIIEHKKLEWMRNKADYIDPFVNRKDELLDKKDIDILINPKIIKTSESKSSYDYYNTSPQYSYWQLKNIWHK